MRRKRIEDPAHLRRIRSMPCIACSIMGVEQKTVTESHHIRRRPDGQDYGRGVKADDTEAIPLCHTCHWNGIGGIFTRREFEEKFGNERELLARTIETIDNYQED